MNMVGEHCPASDIPIGDWSRIYDEINGVIHRYEEFLENDENKDERNKTLDFNYQVTGGEYEFFIGVRTPDRVFHRVFMVVACFGKKFSISVTEVLDNGHRFETKAVVFDKKFSDLRDFLDELYVVLTSVNVAKIEWIERYNVQSGVTKPHRSVLIEVITKDDTADYFDEH